MKNRMQPEFDSCQSTFSEDYFVRFLNNFTPLKNESGKLSKIGVMSAAFYYCHGNLQEKSLIFYELLSASTPESIYQGVLRNDATLKEIIDSMILFASVYSDMFQQGVGHTSPEYLRRVNDMQANSDHNHH